MLTHLFILTSQLSDKACDSACLGDGLSVICIRREGQEKQSHVLLCLCGATAKQSDAACCNGQLIGRVVERERRERACRLLFTFGLSTANQHNERRDGSGVHDDYRRPWIGGSQLPEDVGSALLCTRVLVGEQADQLLGNLSLIIWVVLREPVQGFGTVNACLERAVVE